MEFEKISECATKRLLFLTIFTVLNILGFGAWTQIKVTGLDSFEA